MKIYILPVNGRFQVQRQAYNYPQHNDDFGVEQDFHAYLLEHTELITENPAIADWHYLPVYWTRWHVNHDYGKQGLPELQKEVDKIVLDDKKTFTICQYDDGPLINLGSAVIFLSSRMGKTGIDIPLLSTPHENLVMGQKRKYPASFIGNLESHPLRQKMADSLKDDIGIYLFDSHKKRNILWQKILQAYLVLRYGNRSLFFVKKTLQSYISLCPRGYGGSSFRFFEAMQLGVAPLLLGDIDTRPFKKYINWDDISFYASDADNVAGIISGQSKEKLLIMGKKAQEMYYQKLAYKAWCTFVIKELETIQ